MTWRRRPHSGQRRASGDEFVSHAVEVATILATFGLDTDSLVSGLVHDVVEDTSVSVLDIEKRFGQNVATIVEGVTKIGRVEFRSNTEQQVENYRKLLLSMAGDARVILVKLADRLHNMRTLDALKEEKQRRIALETREIYAPLAHRLGMAAIRWELEDLAFKYLEPGRVRGAEKKGSAEKKRARATSYGDAEATRRGARRGGRPRRGDPGVRSTSGPSTSRWWAETCRMRKSTT